jgi:polyphosphate glucokinase
VSGGVILPDRSPETLERYSRSFYGSSVPVTPRSPEDQGDLLVLAPEAAPLHSTARTLAVDVGGSGVKGAILDTAGAIVVPRQRLLTNYPCPPAALIEQLTTLAGLLGAYDRVSVGFPGMVRAGLVLTAPKFVTGGGAGTPVEPDLLKAWTGFPLAAVLTQALGAPTRIANDADLQGAAVVSGQGYELVLTLGTGFGTSCFSDGDLLPHLEFAHHPFRHGQTYEEQLGDAARKEVGSARWVHRVRIAIATLRDLTFFDHCYIGGGNAKRLGDDLGPDVTTVPNTAGIQGGIALWRHEDACL